jgi:hypothetical protein
MARTDRGERILFQRQGLQTLHDPEGYLIVLLPASRAGFTPPPTRSQERTAPLPSVLILGQGLDNEPRITDQP